MDSRFHQGDLGAAASLRKGSVVELAGCFGKHSVPDVLHTGCSFMTNPTLASCRVRGSSSFGEETDSAELSWLLGPFLYEQL